MKNFLKNKFPDLWQFIRSVYEALKRIPELPQAFFHLWRRHSVAKLKALKNIHQGKRAFIIGNGPSLKNTDLSRLKNEITFGLNRIYLLFPELGFSTTYFVSINDLVIQQCADEILSLNIPKFLSWRSHVYFDPLLELSEIPTFLYTTYNSPKFAQNVRGRIWEGATVTYVALQLAFHMGFSEVILVGVDHNFVTQGEANKTITSQGDDPNHFAPNYFGKGFKWQLPDLETSERAYILAKHVYEKNQRKVFDATVGGKLTVFEKVDYNSLFKSE